jgi:GntR family transcriptional regulator
VSSFEFAAAVVGSMAWPVAVVLAVFMLRKPLATAFDRVRKVEALGVSAELDAVEHAREDVEQQLSDPERDIDELVERAADYGWHLGRAAPNVPPAVQIDRSSESPAIYSSSEELLKRSAAELTPSTQEHAWKVVANRLEAMILTGQLSPGEKLPSITHIAQEYGVSLNTARHAIHALTARGLLITTRVNGVFVATPNDEDARPPAP